jgi:small GTP-binding protein
MRVIGTAGHVDHGKTALIQALTGMDADRLPEEKARGMTTDLGFAWYEDEEGQPIGVVDVPGHERYLRNMVAGAWGLDLALLLIAADDGWMPQTELHASILASLGIAGLIALISKADLAGEARLSELEADLGGRLGSIFGRPVPVLRVAATQGRGITELKAAISAELRTLPVPEPAKAYYYLDRSFKVRAGGTVVTGTLRGGPIAAGDRLTLWPRGEPLKVKGVQSYRVGRERAEAGSRAALAVPALKDEYARGQLLTDPALIPLSGRDFLCKLLPLPGGDTLCPGDKKGRPFIRPGVEAELALGSAKTDATLWPIKDSPFLRVRAGEAIACPPGFPFVLLRKGGAELIGRGLVVSAGTVPGAAAGGKAGARQESSAGGIAPGQASGAVSGAAGGVKPGARQGSPAGGPEREPGRGLGSTLRRADEAAASLRAAGLKGSAGAILAACAELFARDYGELASYPGFESLPDEALAAAALLRVGPYLVARERYSSTREVLQRLASKPGGMNRAEADSAAALPPALTGAALAALEREGALVKEAASWKRPGSEPELSPAQGLLLKRLAAAGKEGLEPGKSAPSADAAALKELCSLRKAQVLDGGIFLERKLYDGLVAAVLRGRKPSDRFSVSEAKERTGLSRKYILPLLNRMESEGYVKRWNDERTVVKLP